MSGGPAPRPCDLALIDGFSQQVVVFTRFFLFYFGDIHGNALWGFFLLIISYVLFGWTCFF